MRPHRLLATLGALALTCSLAACSDEPQPIIEATPSTGPTSDPPPSPTPTATPVPDEPESAKEFIRRWQKEALAMQVSGDSTAYRKLTRNCGGCDAFADNVDRIYGDGGSIEIAASRVRAVSLVGRADGVSIVEFDVISSPTIVRDSTGSVAQELSGGRTRFQANIAQPDDTWRVLRISELV
ncbi:MAG: hypothetical protein OSB43_11385 [Nocardioides sp.]|uniref:hypothetical protein n=1 Tax=Nocardioides sp. TaxID=35761 RepID=UPI00238B63F9|nr:hypothetical protein [Nocardioides sp.]MDE0776868.1 hypothetical protein [Nocardioides sp.]